MPTALADASDDLTFRCALYLRALRYAQASGRRVSPTLPLTIEVMDELEGEGLIEVDWAGCADQPMRSTPAEAIGWRTAGHWDAFAVSPLTQRMSSKCARDCDMRTCCLEIWQSLVHAESEVHCAAELRRWHLDPAWARDLTYVAAQQPMPLSVVQWHACIAAAVRAGARAYRRSASLAPARDAFYRALCQHTSCVAGRQPVEPCLGQDGPRSALARIFATHSGLGAGYFLLPPTHDAWSRCRRARSP